MRVDIRPLSVNEGYKGRRFKTDKYKRWEMAVLLLLPNNFIRPKFPYEIYLKFGFTSSRSDFDNCIKHFVDCLQKKYHFNDKHIRRAVIETEIVKPGFEFIEWDLKHLKCPPAPTT